MKKYFYIALLLFVSANVYSQYSMDGDFACDHNGENNPALGAQWLHAQEWGYVNTLTGEWLRKICTHQE